MKLYVGNLSVETSEADLRALFEPFGTVAEINIINDRMTGRPPEPDKSRSMRFEAWSSWGCFAEQRDTPEPSCQIQKSVRGRRICDGSLNLDIGFAKMPSAREADMNTFLVTLTVDDDSHSVYVTADNAELAFAEAAKLFPSSHVQLRVAQLVELKNRGRGKAAG